LGTGPTGPTGPIGPQGVSTSIWTQQPVTNYVYYNDGNVGIGTATPSTKLEVNGVCTATSYVATSDYRSKMNVTPLSESKTVDLLQPIEYDLVEGSHDMGFLAHEVQEVFPFLVSGKKDDESKLQRLNYNGLIALLVKEIQELKKRVTILERK
jgi:hypothetical protein